MFTTGDMFTLRTAKQILVDVLFESGFNFTGTHPEYMWRAAEAEKALAELLQCFERKEGT